MVSLMSSNLATSLRFSSIIPSLLSPLMNCSVSYLSYSLYCHSTTFVLSIPIHSCMDSLIFLYNLWYCNEITILLCNSLNFLHNTMKRPFAVLNFSFSSWVKLINCRSSWLNQFLSLGLFCPQKSLHTFVYRMFKTYISKFYNSRYLSCVPLRHWLFKY